MWALEQAGASPPEGYWKVVDAAWRRAQSEYGGWNYHPSENGATCSMTAAGVATLFITQDYALQHNWGQCQGGVKDPAIDRGLAWMDHNIDEAVSSSCYTIFGIERIGAASGRTTFGSRDWFQVGADYLINHQKEDGSWKTDHGEVPDTSFALLFLSRGRAPVLMNKLEYDATDPGDKPVVDAWNQRPRDVANLASWAGRQEESYFNWQIVDLKTSLERLHDSPVLMICGSRPLEFTMDQKNALRTFVEDGGMIVGNADCGQAAFSDSFVKLGRELFPRYQFGGVPPNDLLWSEQYTQWRTKPEVSQMTNGVRKLMMLIPTADAARAWQAHLEGPREPLFELGVSMFLYAADRKHLQTKDAPYVVQIDTTIKGKRRLKLVRLMVGDNPDPEPGGWRRLSAILHNQRQIDLTLLSAAPGEGLLAAVKIAHLTGTTTISLSEPARTEIRAFVQNGGTLIVDSAGGGAAFADAAQAELEHIFGAGKIVLLPPDSPVYHQKGITFGTVPWRRFAQAHVANQKAPQLHGIMTGSRDRGVLQPRGPQRGSGRPASGRSQWLRTQHRHQPDAVDAAIRNNAGVTPITHPLRARRRGSGLAACWKADSRDRQPRQAQQEGSPRRRCSSRFARTERSTEIPDRPPAKAPSPAAGPPTPDPEFRREAGSGPARFGRTRWPGPARRRRCRRAGPSKPRRPGDARQSAWRRRSAGADQAAAR